MHLIFWCNQRNSSFSLKKVKTLKNAETKHWREVCFHSSPNWDWKKGKFTFDSSFCKAPWPFEIISCCLREIPSEEMVDTCLDGCALVQVELFLLHNMLLCLRMAVPRFTLIYTFKGMTDKLTKCTVVFWLAAIWGLQFSVKNRAGSKWYATQMRNVKANPREQQKSACVCRLWDHLLCNPVGILAALPDCLKARHWSMPQLMECFLANQNAC